MALSSANTPLSLAVIRLLVLALGAWGASLVGLSLATAGGTADVSSEVVAADASGPQFVVRFRPGHPSVENGAMDGLLVQELHDLLGRSFVASPTSSERNYLLRLTESVSDSEAAHLLGLLRMRPDVVYAEFAPSSRPTMASSKAVTRPRSTNSAIRRLIVIFADPARADISRNNALPDIEWDRALSASAGVPAHVVRATVNGAWVVEVLAAVDVATAEAIAAQLQADGVARIAVPDYALTAMLIPNDPLYQLPQWSLDDPASAATYHLAGIDAVQAWDVTTGSPDVVVAIVDTGITPHPDLASSRMLPGYNFISDPVRAGNGVGRGIDATDLGDWRTAGMCPAPYDMAANSSWHGTLVTGIVAATGNNGIGIAGIDWHAQVLPIRVLGKCSSSTLDIVEGTAWAVGAPVQGIPNNPTPANIVNLSLAGDGACTPALQSFFDAILDAGIFIAAAAGNDDADAGGIIPASCLGITTVGATSPYGRRAQYSNFGPRVDISAPGGASGRAGDTANVVSTWNSGTTVVASPGYASAQGTSISTPHVAAVASLMLAVNPGLTPAQIKQLMIETATPFPDVSDCHPGFCGAGIVNAYNAVRRAAAGVSLFTPVAGVWYDPNESGSGYALDYRNGVLIVQVYSYLAGGAAQWYLGAGSITGNVLHATLDRYTGGQCISCAYVAPTLAGNDGNFTLTFTSPTTADIALPGGRTGHIRRYFPPGAPQPDSAPVAGVWYDPNESGSGYGLDYQNGVLIVQVYSYLAGGAAQWYLGAGGVTNNVFHATLDRYTGGQCISCAYRAPTLVGNDGNITLTFTSPTTADIALPGGRTGHIRRYFQP